MSDWSRLERFLQTDPFDVGCAEAFQLIDVYVELILSNGEPELIYPGIAVHLRACPPCAQDFEGLLAMVSGSAS